jgi:starch-binding outer membrane protein, SusD/RagB family
MKKLIILLLATMSLSSCLNDFLDVKPVSSTSSANFWKTENDVRGELNSIYAFMQQNINTNNGYNYMAWYEARSDNFIGSTTATALPMSVVNMNKLSSVLPATDWNVWYKEIAVANNAIYFIPNIVNMATASKNNYLAEAYFLRAYCYFNLIRIWGDVPMVTTPVITVDQITRPTQTPKKMIMDSLILPDLKSSLAMVSAANTTEIFRFSRGALYSLCTDVAMWNHDFQGAINYSGLLYSLNYKLVAPADFYKVCGTGTTSENIWTLNWSYANNGPNQVVYSLHNTAVPYLVVSDSLRAKWNAAEWKTDVRRDQSINATVAYNPDPTQLTQQGVIWKWEPTTRANTTTTNERYIPLYRLADIVLLRAEAYNQLGDTLNALKELNNVRINRGLLSRNATKYKNAVDVKYALESDILQERQFELLAEGRRWFDLIRTGRVMSVMNNFYTNYLGKGGATNYNLYTASWQLYWPIFQDNITGNPNLKQLGNY